MQSRPAFVFPAFIFGILILYMPEPVLPMFALCSMGALALAAIKQKRKKAAPLSQSSSSKDCSLEKAMQRQHIQYLNGVLEEQVQKHRRLAVDLHENLGALLSTARLHISALDDKADSNTYHREQYLNASRLLDTACDEIRRLSDYLLSEEKERIGIKGELHRMSSSLEAETGLKLHLSLFGLEGNLGIRNEVIILELTREMVRPLARVGSGELSLALTRRENELNIILEPVESDGNSGITGVMTEGMFHLFIERASALGAVVDLDRRQDGGIIVSLDISLGTKPGLCNLDKLN